MGMGIIHTKTTQQHGRGEEGTTTSRTLGGSVKYATQVNDYKRYNDKTVKRYEKTIDDTAVRIAVALDP
jgi:ribosomal protein L2